MSVRYAIIRSSGRQYHVRKGTVIEVAPLSAKPGEQVTVGDVLLLGESGAGALLDAKALQSAKVTAKVLAHAHADKIRVTKFRRRKNYRRTLGHRQSLTRLEIMSIEGAAPAAAAETGAQTETEAKHGA